MGPQRAWSEREGLEDDRCGAADLLRQRVEQMLDGDGALVGFLLGAREEREHRRGEIREARARLGELRQLGLGLGDDVRRIGAGLLEDLGHAAIAVERTRQQMDGLDLDVLALVGEGLSAGHQCLCIGGVTLEVNRLLGRHGSANVTRRASRFCPGVPRPAPLLSRGLGDLATGRNGGAMVYV